MKFFPKMWRAAQGCVLAAFLGCGANLLAAEFIIRVNLQAEGTWVYPPGDIKWTDTLTESLSTEKRYEVVATDAGFQSGGVSHETTSSSVGGAGLYDDGVVAQCAWRYARDTQSEPGVNGSLKFNPGPDNASSSCGLHINWPMVKIEDPDCQGQFVMVGDLQDCLPRDYQFNVPTKKEPWSFTETYSTNFQSPLGIDYLASQTVTVQFIPDTGPELKIISVDTPIRNIDHSFVATDLITVKASLKPPREGVTVKWTVQGLEAAANVGGFPEQEATTTDSAGVATFSFTPASNPTFVNNRRSAWTNGSEDFNPPIGFEITAVVPSESPPLVAKLSQAALGGLLQDESDILRQEFFDYPRGVVPPRSEITRSLGGYYNRGNYTVQRNYKLKEHYDRILQAYRGSIITIDGEPVPIPADARVALGRGGGFRCPRRNVAAGSRFPVTSYHTRGRALDLVPELFDVSIKGKRKALTAAELHSQLYPALLKAALAVVKPEGGSALSEDGSQPVTVGCCGCTAMEKDKNGNWVVVKVKDKNGNLVTGIFCEDHIHVQWP